MKFTIIFSFISDRNNNKIYNAKIEEKIDNLLKIKIENKEMNQKSRSLIIVDKNSECIGKKNNYSGDIDQAISSTTKEQSNSDDMETQANKSEVAI